MAKKASQITLADKGAIVALRNEGLTHRAIAKRLDFHHSTIGKFLTSLWHCTMKKKIRKKLNSNRNTTSG